MRYSLAKGSLYALAAISLVLAMVIAQSMADERAGLKYIKSSKYSNRDIVVEVVSARGSKIGCSAINKNGENHFGMFKMASGDGSISIVAESFNISLDGKEHYIAVKLGSTDYPINPSINGNLVTLSFSKEQMRNLESSKVIGINGKEVSPAIINQLIAVVDRCAGDR